MAVFYMRLTVSEINIQWYMPRHTDNYSGIFGWICSQNQNILRSHGDNVHYCRLYAFPGLHSH